MPKVVDHEMRRRSLASTAGELVAAQGLQKASMREVAKAAGVTTGTLSYYFDDNHELLFAAYQLAYDACSERFRTALQQPSLQGLKDGLFNCLPTREPTLSEWKIRLAFWEASGFAEEVVEFEKSCGEQFRRFVARSLQKLSQRESLTLAMPPANAARFLETLMTGMAIQCLVTPGLESTSSLRRRLNEHIDRGILA